MKHLIILFKITKKSVQGLSLIFILGGVLLCFAYYLYNNCNRVGTIFMQSVLNIRKINADLVLIKIAIIAKILKCSRLKNKNKSLTYIVLMVFLQLILLQKYLQPLYQYEQTTFVRFTPTHNTHTHTRHAYQRKLYMVCHQVDSIQVTTINSCQIRMLMFLRAFSFNVWTVFRAFTLQYIYILISR